MNCLAHAFRFFDRGPRFVLGTCVPDWLAMVDRGNRVRQPLAKAFCDHRDRDTREIAQGIVQHHRDDDWFHRSPAFTRELYQFTAELRDLLRGDRKFRPQLVAHIVIEMLLDAALAQRDPQLLPRYYRLIAQSDPAGLQTAINQMTGRSSTKLQSFLPVFVQEKYLYDYRMDHGIEYRINRILARLRCDPMPGSFSQWVGSARRRVDMDEFDALASASMAPVHNLW